MTDMPERDKTTYPKISIVTLSLNQGRFIEQTIESVLSQDYPNIEYIIIDGGSTDGTVDIIKRYENRISFWISEPDDGISDAFNKGIRASRGEIVGILNAGDIYKPSAVSSAAEALFKGSDYDFTYGDIEFIDEEGNFLYLMKGEKDYLPKISYTMYSIIHPTVFVRKKVYDSCGLFDKSYRIAMDYEFLLRIIKSGKKGLYLDIPVAQMRTGGVSNNKFYAGYEEVCRASILYGYNPILARLRLYIKVVRGFGRVFLERLGLHGIVKWTRRTFWNIKDMPL